MTSLLPAPRQTARSRPDRSDAAHRRPLVLLAALAGVVSAGSTLLVCLATGVVGWFLTDAGAHGAPRDGLRVGAITWLMSHGSGVHVAGVAITAVPLGLSLVCAIVVWRIGLRLGDAVSGHGPDADAIADGVRDWTVGTAAAVFTVGYGAVVVLTQRLATTPATAPSLLDALVWTAVLCGAVGTAAIAVGSGRAAIWTAFLPPSVRATAAAARTLLVWYAVVSLVVFVVALAVDWGDAVNVMSQLHSSPGSAAVLVGICVLLVPNATLFSGSYLLGPGFAVGAHTLVTPTAVVMGPLPMFPLLAALPKNGPPAGWTVSLLVLPLLVSALAAYRVLRPTASLRWDEAAVRGAGTGLAAAIGIAFLAWLAGGAVGPGRMQHVGPFTFQVLLHAIATFGVGGLLGALGASWRARRTS